MKKLFAILLVLLIPTLCFAGGSSGGNEQDQNQSQGQQQNQYNEQKQYNNQWNNQNTYQWTNQNNNQKVIANPTLNANPTINVTTGQPTPVVPINIEGTTLSVQQPNQDVSTIVENPKMDLGQNRQFITPSEPIIPNVMGYSGPFSGEAWNIINDIGLLPKRLTAKEAENLSKIDKVKKNGIKVYVSVLSTFRYGYDYCDLVTSVGKGKIIGYAYIESAEFTSKANAVMSLVAMDKGANKIMLANRAIDHRPSSKAFGLGGSGTTGILSGDKMQVSSNGSGVIGFASSSAKDNKTEGLVYILIRDE